MSEENILTKILISKSQKVNWELVEELIQLSNGFEENYKYLTIWVLQEIDKIISLLTNLNIEFEIVPISSKR